MPQYYVENNYQVIISPSVFEEAQHQMAARNSGKNRASSAGASASQIKCENCRGWYGSKVWHSNSKYRRAIWQCNHKFDGGEKCCTSHLDEDTIQALFLKAVDAIFAEKDGVREDYDSIKDTLSDTFELEAERLHLQEGMNVVAELLIEQCMAESARVALDQTEYQKSMTGWWSVSTGQRRGWRKLAAPSRSGRQSGRRSGDLFPAWSRWTTRSRNLKRMTGTGLWTMSRCTAERTSDSPSKMRW